MLRNVALTALCVASVSAQSLETLSANYRKTPNPRTRAAILRFANAHPADKDGALALLVLGQTEVDQRQFGDGLQHLKAAQSRLPNLADYAGYWEAVAENELRQFAEIEQRLGPVWNRAPASPLIANAAELAVHSYLETSQPEKALMLITQHLTDLTEPHAELLLARSYEADKNLAAAAVHYQKIYIEFPLSKEASEAQGALERYPVTQPQVLLARGLKLIECGDYARARKELTSLLPQLSGADLDLARVRIGAAQYQAREYKQARDYLESFQASGEPEAERLYYLLECARRLDRVDEMNGILDRLSKSYAQSGWRLRAMLTAASYYSSHNQRDAAEPLYQACYESFPKDPQTAQCQWKVAWAEYLRNPSNAAGLLQDHLRHYPDSDHASTALYFLGRIAESKADRGAARVFYEALNQKYPNYYYATLARDRLRQASIAASAPTAETVQFLSGIQFPTRGTAANFVATSATKARIDRAELLAQAGLSDLAEGELRFGAKTDGQPELIALELADLANRREAPDQAIRYIKRYAPGYMAMSLDTAPEKFWRLAFPLPYRKALEDYCRERSLDPFVVAALIRQESEFNIKATSRASARGLTQIMPATGRELSRKLKIPRYRTSMLYSADTNLKLGTYYLKALFDQLQGKWEETLASYNAGKSRVNSWVSASNYHEPAEFVESIPFNETRLYVQSVLRNAEVYRRIYGQQTR